MVMIRITNKGMPVVSDLRTYMELLRKQGELNLLESPVDLEQELGSILATVEKGGLPAVHFKNLKGRPGEVVGGLLSSHKKIALALGCETNEISKVLMEAYEHPVKPKEVATAEFHANILTGTEASLLELPIPTHAPLDGGPFITAGACISKDPETGRQNVSFQRMHIKSANRSGIMINEWRHLREMMKKAWAKGEGLPIAVAVGVDPAILIAAGFRYDGDEMEIASAIRKQPIKVVKCQTSDIMVPAHAEFVLEGEILPDTLEKEGPLAEFTGHYGKLWESPVFKLKAICRRDGAIWQTMNGGSFEHINLGNVLPREPLLEKHCTYVSANVLDVHIPPYGSGFLAIVQMRKSNDGEPKNVAMAAMTSHVNIKNVIVVDEDTDIYNAAEVWWAVTNRVNPREDVFVIPNSQGHELDPCSDSVGVQNKTGIDATSKAHMKDLKKVVYPSYDLSTLDFS